MRTLFAIFLFLSMSSVGFGQKRPIPLQTFTPVASQSEASPKPETPPVTLIDCVGVEKEIIGLADGKVEGLGKLTGVYASAMLALNLLANALGFLATKGNPEAGKALAALRYAISLLGWFSGKLGWGAPRYDVIKKFPRWRKPAIKA